MKHEDSFAEVVESALHIWTAHSWQWDQAPPFGSLVSTTSGNRTILGIVHQTQTGSMDPNRHPFPFQKTEEELRLEQPQIFEFLKTTFTCLTVGYREKEQTHYTLAPTPPKIHAFVQATPKDIAAQFFSNDRYLHLLFGAAGLLYNLDELLLAVLREIAATHTLSQERLEQFMQTYALLAGNDYRRLKLFLQRAEPILGRATQQRSVSAQQAELMQSSP